MHATGQIRARWASSWRFVGAELLRSCQPDVECEQLSCILVRQLSLWSRIQGAVSKAATAEKEPPEYPETPYRYRLGKYNIIDNYWWLSDYPTAKTYLGHEQQYYQQASACWSQKKQQLLSEMRRHLLAAPLADVPEQVGHYLYWTVTNPHGQDTVMRRYGQSGQEQTVLSATTLQEDAHKLSLLLGKDVAGDHVGGLKLSQDQQLLAYAVSVSAGSEQYCCAVKDLRTGDLVIAGVIPDVKSFEWSADARCLYYCLADEQGRPSKVYRCTMSAVTASEDELLFTEPDPRHFVTLTRTKDWRYVLINTHAKLSSEVWLLDGEDLQALPVCVQQRTPGLEYFVEHYQGHLLLLTNKPISNKTATNDCIISNASGVATFQTSLQQFTHSTEHTADLSSTSCSGSSFPPAAAADSDGTCSEQEYSLMTTPAASITPGQHNMNSWELLVPERAGVVITDMDVFDGCVLLHELSNARPSLTLIRICQREQHMGLDVLQQQQVCFDDWVFAVRPGINQDYRSDTVRLYASSPATREVAMELNLNSGQLQSWDQQVEKQHNSWPAKAGEQTPVCQRLWATAGDGVQIPITLLHMPALRYDAQAPLLIEVYGAYGQVLDAEYKAYRLPLLHRGWSVALAHVRGGGELGRRWHAAGRQLQKVNSVNDFLACLRHLFDQGVTAPGRVAAHAASAGGLVVAAAVNIKPEYFSSAVLEAPFVDWTGAMGDAGHDHLLAQHEVDEWGDPVHNQQVAEMIQGICPYHNLAQGKAYPAMMLTAGLIDTRVSYHMPAKYVAKRRTIDAAEQRGYSKQGKLVVLKFDEEAGHFSMGHAGGDLDDIADQYAFMLHCQDQ